MLDPAAGGKEASRATVEQHGNVFRAEIFVPVWTSLLYVNDWFEPGAQPISATLTNRAGKLEITVENLLNRPLTEARLAHNHQMYDLGALAAGEKKTITLDPTTATSLQSWVAMHASDFQSAVQYRRNPLGDARSGHLENLPVAATAASFFGQLINQPQQRSWVAPPGLDLTPLVDRGDAVLLAWDANQTYASPMNLFKPPRLQRNTLLRLVVPAALGTRS